MITPKEATKRAADAARDLYEGESLQYLRLEEIELSDDGQFWDVTLGWVEPAVRTHSPMLGLDVPEILALPRVYKTFRIRADTGAFHSMAIRAVR